MRLQCTEGHINACRRLDLQQKWEGPCEASVHVEEIDAYSELRQDIHAFANNSTTNEAVNETTRLASFLGNRSGDSL